MKSDEDHAILKSIPCSLVSIKECDRNKYIVMNANGVNSKNI